jgi:hypothetical protein
LIHFVISGAFWLSTVQSRCRHIEQSAPNAGALPPELVQRVAQSAWNEGVAPHDVQSQKPGRILETDPKQQIH